MKSLFLRLRTLLLLSMFSMLSACASMSTLQTARTLAPGQAQSTFGGGVFESSEAGNSSSALTKIQLPYLEYTYRQGLTDKIDAGVKLTLIGTLSLDAKYALYAGEKFAAAVGGGIGYMSYSTGSDDSKNEYKIIDVMLPLILSYDFNPIFSAYTSPRYLQRTISGSSSSSTGLAGAALGVKVGKTSGAFVEVASYKDLKSNNGMTQANVSWFWTPTTYF